MTTLQRNRIYIFITFPELSNDINHICFLPSYDVLE